MSDFFVMLVFKTVIYKSKLLGFKDLAGLELEHSELTTDFMDEHELVVGRLFNLANSRLTT